MTDSEVLGGQSNSKDSVQVRTRMLALLESLVHVATIVISDVAAVQSGKTLSIRSTESL